MRTLAHYGPRASALVSSVIFAMVHMLTGRVNPLNQLALFLHGYLFAILAQRSRSLWPGVPNTALLAFDGSLGWTKWAFKAAMVIPFLLTVRYIYRQTEKPA